MYPAPKSAEATATDSPARPSDQPPSELIAGHRTEFQNQEALRVYTLSMGTIEQDYPTRAEAIEAAKEMTDGSFKKAHVTDESGRESMTYIAGGLDHYEYDTRRGRP